MDKKLKKLSSIVLCTAILVVATLVGVFADEVSIPNLVKVDFSEKKYRMVGKAHLEDAISNSGNIVEENGQKIYKGEFGGEVESSDLFEEAFDAFNKNIKGKTLFGKKIENIVMFDAGGKYPTCKLVIKFPSEFNVSKDDVIVNENTEMINGYEVSETGDKEITIKFNLGNWDDYAGFFARFENEFGVPNHKISVKIPYSVNINDETSNVLGKIEASGECMLWKVGGFYLGDRNIVNVKAEKSYFDILLNESIQ